MILTLLPLLDATVYKFGDDVVQCNYTYITILPYIVWCLFSIYSIFHILGCFACIIVVLLYHVTAACFSDFRAGSVQSYSFSKKSRQSLIHAAYNNTRTFPAQTDQMRSVSENIIFGQLVPAAERRFGGWGERSGRCQIISGLCVSWWANEQWISIFPTKWRANEQLVGGWAPTRYGKLLLKTWSLRIYFPFGMVYVQELCECSIGQMGEKTTN